MEVLNKKERLSSFLLFLFLFLLTIGIILAAVFFDFQIPKKELKTLRGENTELRNEYAFQKKFSGKLEETKIFTDLLDVDGEDFYYNHQLANNSMIEMQKMIPAGDTLRGNNMYDNMVLTYRDLIDSKRTINVLDANKEELEKLRQQVEVYSKELEIVKRDLEVCRIVNRQ